MSNSSAALPLTGGYTRLYTFPESLNLSNDNAMEDLLADIPIFAIGLLSFGVFTFFLTMKRVNILVVILYISVFFAFIASILDLTHVLASGHSNGDNNANTETITSLLIVREVGFAISIGLRFLFFWLFVAEPPREESATEPKPTLFAFIFKEPTHSAAWGRLGINGIILKWSLLAIVLLIGVFQVVWRVAPGENRMGAVYAADATMEIVASALFILKLLMNACIAPSEPLSKTFRRYAAIALALVINLGLGIGNVTTFAFSESTLGRFLQAIEFYILILYVLISSFYNYIPARHAEVKTQTPFRGLPETKRRSTFRISPFTLTADPLPLDSSYQNPPYVNGRSSALSRGSVASRLSSWIAARRMSDSRSGGAGDQIRLWNQDQAERGQSPVDQKVINSLGSPYSYDSVVDQPNESPNPKEPMSSVMNSSMHNKQQGSLSKWTTATGTIRNSINDGPVAKEAPSSDTNPAVLQTPKTRKESLAYSIGSYYGADSGPSFPPSNSPPLTVLPRNADSPIYGLDGIMRRVTGGRQTPGSTERSRSTIVSLTELLRRQTELDDSIAPLRLLSPAASQRQSGSGSRPASPSDRKDRNRLSPPVGEPSATRSEFSLSHFPEPPLMLSPQSAGMSSPKADSVLTIRVDGTDEGRSRLTLRGDGIAGLPLPRMPVLNDCPTTPQSIPGSPGQGGDVLISSRMGKFNSAGTQYDVTSFIGNLTAPGIKKGSTHSKLNGIDHEDGGSETTIKPTHGRKRSATILALVPTDDPPNSKNNAPNLSTNGNFAGLGVGEVVTKQRGSPAGTTGLPVRPRLIISGPKRLPQDGNGEQAPSAFERPRPPPLILQQPNGNVMPPGRSL